MPAAEAVGRVVARDRHRSHADGVLGRGDARLLPAARRRRRHRAAAARTARYRLSGLVAAGARRCTRARGSAPTCSSSPTACCPRETFEAAEVMTTRVEPEMYVPPLPGRRGPPGRGQPSATTPCSSTGWSSQAAHRPRPRRRAALRQPRVPRRHAVAPTSTSRASRAWPPRRATPPSCCTACSRRACWGRGGQHQGAGLQREGRGPALPRPRRTPGSPTPTRTATAASACRRTRSTRCRSTPRRARATATPAPTSPPAPPACTPSTGPSPSSASERAAAVRVRRRRGRAPAVHDGRPQRHRPPQARRHSRSATTARGRSTAHGPTHLRRPRRPDRRAGRTTTTRRSTGPGPATGMGTVNAFVRRLLSSQAPLGAPRPRRRRACAEQHRISTSDAQVTVVDLHNLHDRAQRFVVGVTLQRAFDDKEQSGHGPPAALRRARRAQQVRARARARRPIKEILLDVAERGRSLGVILIGAQQTASEVERRVIANSADPRRRPARPRRGGPPRVRVPARRPPAAGHHRQARHHVREPAGDPGAARRRVPVPGLGDPALGACGPAETALPGAGDVDDPFAVAVVKLLHTADWHVGQGAEGRRSGSTSSATVLAEIVALAEREAVDLGARRGRPLRVGRAGARGPGAGLGDAARRCGTPGPRSWSIAGNHDPAERLRGRPAPVFAAAGITMLGRPEPPDAGRRRRAHGPVHRRAVRAGAAAVRVPARHRARRRADRARRRQRRGRLRRSASQRRRPRSPRELRPRRRQRRRRPRHGARRAMVGGGERDAQTIFELLRCPPQVFPPSASYVALGHLHRTQQLPGSRRRSGTRARRSPSTSARRSRRQDVLVVEAAPGTPAKVRAVPLAVRRRPAHGARALAELAALAASASATTYCASSSREPARAGLADEVRALLGRTARRGADRARRRRVAARRPRPAAGGRPHELFAAVPRRAGDRRRPARPRCSPSCSTPSCPGAGG